MRRETLILIGVLLAFELCYGQKKVFYADLIHTAENDPLANAYMYVEGEKIIGISRDKRIDHDSYEFISYAGHQIYPSLIALNTQLGITEIDAVRATRDLNEQGEDNPNVRSIIAYNAQSEVSKTVRSSGVLYAQVCPKGGRWSGMSSLVHLNAWNWKDALVIGNQGLHLQWPEAYQSHGWWADKKPDTPNEKYRDQIIAIERQLQKAQAYENDSLPASYLKDRSWVSVLRGEKSLYIHTKDSPSILDALLFCKRWGIKPILYANAGLKACLPLLKEHKAHVVLLKTKRLPDQMDAPIDQYYRLATQLSEEEITFSLASEGSWQQRNLVYQAAQAISYGLDPTEALASISLHPADLLGAESSIGSLSKGKQADFIIVQGDLFDIRSSMVKGMYHRGQSIDISEKQKKLYQTYSKKYDVD